MTNFLQATLVFGSSSGIGDAVLKQLSAAGEASLLVGVSRAPQPDWVSASQPRAKSFEWLRCDYSDAALGRTANEIGALLASRGAELRRVIICNGVLHGDGPQSEKIQPEKRLEQLDSENFLASMSINALLPIRCLQAMLPLLCQSDHCKVAVLSARVGSISDNRLGGWYSYRASKAALNMLLQNASIELARRAPGTKLIAFHPGTTDTPLSRPFQKNVSKEKLFSTEFVAERLLDILDAASTDGALSFIDWDGKPISF